MKAEERKSRGRGRKEEIEATDHFDAEILHFAVEEGRLGADGGDIPLVVGVKHRLWALVLVCRVQASAFDWDAVVAT